jgi:hypothetical protein
MAATEAVEAGDILRAHIAEAHFELDLKNKDACLRKVPMAQVTDCRSLHDLLMKRGSVPEEMRLLLDIEALREQKEFTGLVTRWVNTKQMVADCLTKDDQKAGDYLRYVVRTGYLNLTAIPNIDQVLGRERWKAKSTRQAYYDAKYPSRKNKKDIEMNMFEDDGWSTSLGCSVFAKHRPKTFMLAPGSAKRWRMTLAEEGLGLWADLGIEDWVHLPFEQRKRKVPKQIMRTLSVFAPDKAFLENWKKQFMQGSARALT